MIRKIAVLATLLIALQSPLGWGQDIAALLQQMKFTSMELLIYTDQLQRFEKTACSSSVVSNYTVASAQQQLLAQLRPEHRPEFQQWFESEQLIRLLHENQAGVEALLGPQRLLGGDRNLDPQQRAACHELGAVFQNNYLQTQQDMQLLLERYLQ
jgi:hypothetical protein